MRRLFLLAPLLIPLFGADKEWPVNGGLYNIRYTELTQITPANVGQLKVAWTWDGHEAFKDSEMQSNPIVVEGMLYATTPTMQVVALNAATGSEIWKTYTIPEAAKPTKKNSAGTQLWGPAGAAVWSSPTEDATPWS